MSFNTQKTNKLGKLGVADKCNFCMNRLDQGLLPACVITCLGVTLEYGDFDALRAKYPNAKEMHDDDKPRMLYGNLGEEPKHRTAGYPNPAPCHD
jgi:Fe-S-cluster-containing dehydrogenase component